MKRTQAPLWVAAALLLSSSSCRKENGITDTQKASIIRDARAYFNTYIENASTATPGSIASLGSRTILWQEATVAKDNSTVAIPLSYATPQFLTLGGDIPNYFPINNVSQLLLTKDSVGKWDAVVQIRIPDDVYLKKPDNYFSGTIMQESWEGHPLAGRKVSGEAVNAHAASRSIMICLTIYGYNYAPSDPTAGYHWSQTSCEFINLPANDDRGSNGGGGGGYGDNGGGSGTSSGPRHTIANDSRPLFLPHWQRPATPLSWHPQPGHRQPCRK